MNAKEKLKSTRPEWEKIFLKLCLARYYRNGWAKRFPVAPQQQVEWQRAVKHPFCSTYS